MFEYKPDINNAFEFKWTEYGYSGKKSKTIYSSLIGKFKIGQGVIIKNDMSYYSSYIPMINAMGYSKENMRMKLSNGECGIIVGRKYHEKKNDLIYGVRMDDDKIAIIGECGLKINEDYKELELELLEDKLFEI